jgi:hypothetical protein
MCAQDGITPQQTSESFPSFTLDSWEAFKDFVSRDLLAKDLAADNSLRPRYLFRGHRDETWALEPKFDRIFKILPGVDRADTHELLLENFRKECRNFPQYQEEVNQNMRCLALAQHHGLPTRLLDWTESPYIAAYFAFHAHLSMDHGDNDSGKDKKVAIWILDRKEKHYWSGDRGVELVDPMSWSNERCKRQLGWFTFARTPFRNLQEYVLQLGNEKHALRKVTMSAGLAELALKDLELMRISARELFPDLTGAAVNAFIRSVLT